MATDLEELTERLRTFAAERDWDRFHDPKNLAMLLASEVGELVAEFRWLTREQATRIGTDSVALEKISREIGDVGIALLRMCDKLGVTLTEAIERKIEMNALQYPVTATRGEAERPPPVGS